GRTLAEMSALTASGSSISTPLRVCVSALFCAALAMLGACSGGGSSTPSTPVTPVAPAPPPLISGDSKRLASAALQDVAASPVSPDDTSSGYLLTRVGAGTQPTTPVAQLNAAAAAVGATSIASSDSGSLLLSLTV